MPLTNEVQVKFAQASPSILSTRAILGLLLLLAIAVRVFLLVEADWLADYDESVVGLMAIDIANGARHPQFFYGQPYLGSLEAYLAAPLFALFGPSRMLLKLVPLAMTLPWLASTYLLARRLSSSRSALLAVLIVALAPAYVLANTLKAGAGTTAEVMPVGNLALLAALNALDGRSHRHRTAWWAACGFALGFGLWLHGLIAYYAVAIAAYALLRRPSLPLRPETWLGLPAFALGAAPLLYYNARHNWTTFSYLLDTGKPKGDGYGADAIAQDMLGRLAPRVFGTADWPWLGTAVAIVVLGLVVVSVVACVKARRRDNPQPIEIVLVLAVAIPVTYLLSGFGDAAINENGIDAAGRYVVPLFALAPLVVAFVHHGVSRLVAISACGLLCISGITGLVLADKTEILQYPYFNRSPASFDGVIAALRKEGVGHVWTDVGLAYPLMFQSGNEILAADFRDKMVGGTVRFPEAYAAVAGAQRTALLVAVLPGQVGPLERELRRLGEPYQKREIANLALLVPERRVEPRAVAAGMGFQY